MSFETLLRSMKLSQFLIKLDPVGSCIRLTFYYSNSSIALVIFMIKLRLNNETSLLSGSILNCERRKLERVCLFNSLPDN